MTDIAPPLNIDVQTVKQWQDEQRDFVLLDCREQVEFDFARIAGATLIPLSEIQHRFGELEPLRDRQIVVHCHHGGRSLQVTNWLRGQGFAQVQNMAGGIDAWSLEIDPALPRYQ
jgi:rhodanese-related sulfurtransferase